jgi:ADP-ribose pyrophosphatase YjhB (NUDIX family)
VLFKKFNCDTIHHIKKDKKMKRQSCRAIIFKDNKLVVMYREKAGRVYFTFPGGGLEQGETLTDCVVRECKEEFGIDIKPIKQVYTYENQKTLQHFFLCKWIGGEFGTGQGEEFEVAGTDIYIPSFMPVDKMQNLPLMPPEVAHVLAQDINQYGYKLSPTPKVVVAKD